MGTPRSFSPEPTSRVRLAAAPASAGTARFGCRRIAVRAAMDRIGARATLLVRRTPADHLHRPGPAVARDRSVACRTCLGRQGVAAILLVADPASNGHDEHKHVLIPGDRDSGLALIGRVAVVARPVIAGREDVLSGLSVGPVLVPSTAPVTTGQRRLRFVTGRNPAAEHAAIRAAGLTRQARRCRGDGIRVAVTRTTARPDIVPRRTCHGSASGDSSAAARDVLSSVDGDGPSGCPGPGRADDPRRAPATGADSASSHRRRATGQPVSLAIGRPRAPRRRRPNPPAVRRPATVAERSAGDGERPRG